LKSSDQEKSMTKLNFSLLVNDTIGIEYDMHQLIVSCIDVSGIKTKWILWYILTSHVRNLNSLLLFCLG